MEDTISYKIEKSLMLPYEFAIENDFMREYEASNQTVASSRIYFICIVRKPGIISKMLSNTSKFPEVLYIGETFNKTKRFERHDKLLKATRRLNRFNNIGVCFLNVRYSYIGSPLWTKDPYHIFDELKDLHSKTAILLLERLYIRLFRPILNKETLSHKLYDDKQIRQKLILNGIRYIHLDIGMNEDEHKYWSPELKSTSDWHYFDLKTGDMHVGMPDLFSIKRST